MRLRLASTALVASFLATALVPRLAAVAHAQEVDPARAKARAIAEKGDLAFGTGRCDQATALWQEADHVFPAPTLKLRIAHCDALLGRVVEAADELQAIVGTKLPPDAPPAWQDAMTQATAELPATRARIATVAVHTETRVPLTQVTVDDKPRPLDARTFSVDPGHHRLALTSGTASAEHPFDVEDGTTRTLTARTFLEPGPEPPHTGRILGLSFGGAGIGALAVGTIFGIAALDISRNLDKDCGGDRSKCAPDESTRITQVKTDAVLADAFLGAGVVLVGVGTFFFVKDLRTPKPDPIPRLTITGSRLVLDGTF